MGKNREIKITTPMELVKPTDLSGSVIGAWEPIVDEFYENLEPNIENIRIWSSGKQARVKKSPLTLEDTDDLKYYHYTRVADKVEHREMALQFRDLQYAIDSEYSLNLGAEYDARHLIQQRLVEDLGRCSLEGMTFRFDVVDIVESLKYPGQKVFVLKRSKSIIEKEQTDRDLMSRKTDEINDLLVDEKDPVDPLRSISGVVANLVKCVDPMIDGLDDKSQIKSVVPFARTKEKNIDLLQNFLNTLAGHLLDPYVELKAGGVDISWEL